MNEEIFDFLVGSLVDELEGAKRYLGRAKEVGDEKLANALIEDGMQELEHAVERFGELKEMLAKGKTTEKEEEHEEEKEEEIEKVKEEEHEEKKEE